MSRKQTHDYTVENQPNEKGKHEEWEESGAMEESTWIDFFMKVFKILAFIITFSVVLGAAAISKGTLLFMTSQISPGQTKPYCNKKLDLHQQFVVTLPTEERTAWIWILMFTFFVPELATFIRSLRICLFKTWSLPSLLDFVSLFITESLPTIGSAILVFCILPELDVVKGIMLTNAVCFIPAVVAFFSQNFHNTKYTVKVALEIFSILCQPVTFVVWPLIEDKPVLWLIPLSVILISSGWWENYVSEDSPVLFIKRLGKSKKKFHNNRYFSYLIISPWKCVLFTITALVIIRINEGKVDFLFADFVEAFQEHFITLTKVNPVISEEVNFDLGNTIRTSGAVVQPSSNLTPLWVFLINIASTYSSYAFGKFACRILIQCFGYAFPVNLAVPFALSLLIGMCGVYNADECSYSEYIPPYLFFNSPPIYFLKDFISSQHTWIWLVWLLSQTLTTLHIWSPQCEELAKTEILYVRPMYDAFFIDQSLALNRRRDDKPEQGTDDNVDGSNNGQEGTSNLNCGNDVNIEISNGDDTRIIYACGTMWRENKEEMMSFLKSIMRLDSDQFSKKQAKKEFESNTIDSYELETHIFFDDAFNERDEDKHKSKTTNQETNIQKPETKALKVNQKVRDLASILNVAAEKVHQTTIIKIKPAVKYKTPYGGRLEWTLPGGTKLVVHLKNKQKILVKKRWSQVMYMYYLLAYRLFEKENLSQSRIDMIAKNTFILALDGDIDFQPDALRHLVILMKKNEGLGAACGRIHPLGSGPLVWYQMFEYAIGHWLQKATEHMIGSVLCSPGCFSLFRAAALMQPGVMNKYTTKSEEAKHFVQYDQGEDRWLCTLLLQRGYRVEYCAASDSYTHCPGGFKEFFNQRRRWITSTMANVLDLLVNYKRTIRCNDDISRIYIFYQTILLIGTILGPGSIFLMLVGAFVAAFDLDLWSSFIWNAVPIVIFMIVCLLFKSDVQLFFAGVLSAIYGLVMMAVLVGVMLQISNDGLLAPASLFFFCVAGEMIVTALLHPKEFGCLLYGLIYYVTVPSMYLLLVIYSIFNLNDISWGTRTDSSDEEETRTLRTQGEQSQKRHDRFLWCFGGETPNDIEIPLQEIFSCMCCTYKRPKEDDLLLQISNRLETIENKLGACKEDTCNINKSTSTSNIEKLDHSNKKKSYIVDEDSWHKDKDLGNGTVGKLPPNEETFWKKLIETYLSPKDHNQKDIAKKLKDLRDKSVMAFTMLNALFVLVVFLLTLKKDILHINWPFDVKVNFTYLDAVDQIEIHKEYLELEPIGFVFVIFFGTLLVVQFIAMLFHRFETFSQILALTSILPNQDQADITKEEGLKAGGDKAIRKIVLRASSEDNLDYLNNGRRRGTVMNLAHTGQRIEAIYTLEELYERRLQKNAKKKGNDATKGALVARAILKRRETTRKLQRNAFCAPIASNEGGSISSNGQNNESGI